ncbi:MAG: protein kinase [Candidatus Obscuribacterales bacterium]|nr:protein kinase [Candidatus Obscuribacterales bacterium]
MPSSSVQKKVCLTCNREYESDIATCPEDGTVLTPLDSGSLVGTVLGGRYEILDVIGDGAMGRVYLAKHQLMKRQVAVKMMHPQLVSGKAALKRFQKEAELASSLNHPNILTVYDFGVTEGGSPYLVMDYLQGRELLHILKDEKTLPVKRSLHIFKQVCTGLGHAHDKGVVHRDLKPSNIMLVRLDEDDNFVKILDFGIAKQLNPSESSIDNLTRTGEVFGTPHYMSPEQCRAQEVDGRADIYALGCVMYQTLTGELPITGGDLIECLYKHVNEMPRSFKFVAPDLELSPELEALVFKAMAKNPEDRFQTMLEFKAAMDILEPDSYTGTFSRVDIPALKIESTIGGATLSAHTETARESPVAGTAESTGSSEDRQDKSDQSAKAESEAQDGEPTAVSAAAADRAQEVTTAEAALVSGANLVSDARPQSQTAIRRALDLKGKTRLLLALPLALIFLLVGLWAYKAFVGDQTYRDLETILAKARREYEVGSYAQAKKTVRQAIKFEDDHKIFNSYRSRYLLGQIQYAQGDYDDAEANLERAYDRIKAVSPGSLELAMVAVPLGRARAALKDFASAEGPLKEAYDIRTNKLKAGDLLIADSLSGLADLNLRRGKLQDALDELKEALQITIDKDGEGSLAAAQARNNLGQAFQLSGDYPMAEKLYKQALESRRHAGQAAAPLVTDSLQCLGALYSATGRRKEALACYKEGLEIGRTVFDKTDPRYAALQARYGEMLSGSR